jgi:hypothetical protein
MSKFEIRPVDEPAERRKRMLRWGVIAVAAVLALAAAGFAAWYFTPPLLPENVEQAKAVLTSPRFERLNKADKQPYYDTIREQFGSLDRDERRRMMEEDEKLRNAMGDAMKNTMEAWGRQWILASDEERAAMEGLWGRGRGNAERPPREDRPEPTEEEKAERQSRGRERMNAFMSNGSGQSSQIIGEFFYQRRQAREGESR